MTEAMKCGYRHKEAFCLMQYRDQATGEIEVLWNSRDGVTPFGITSRSGNEAFHVNWQQDRCVPDFQPTPGMRLFVDASPSVRCLSTQIVVVESRR